MHSRNEYLKVIREKYLRARGGKQKTQLLDEYCGNTGQSRKYLIWKILRGRRWGPNMLILTRSQCPAWLDLV
jgi:hypothetical protein